MSTVLPMLMFAPLFCFLLNQFFAIAQIKVINEDKPCEEGWKYFNGSDSCFKVFTEPAYYLQAELSCEVLDSKLASFSDHDEFEFITNLVNMTQKGSKKQTYFWIGLLHNEKTNNGTKFGEKNRFRVFFWDGTQSDFLSNPKDYDKYWAYNNNTWWPSGKGSQDEIAELMALYTGNVTGLENKMLDLPENQTAAYICKTCVKRSINGSRLQNDQGLTHQ